MRARLVASCLVVGSALSFAQEVPARDGAGLEFLPGHLLLPPLVADYQEPRMGIRKQLGTSRLKLDIGNSLDFLAISDSSGADILHFGVDFFTYALTTSSEGLRLQVDAVDGYFGGHIALRDAGETSERILRLRLLHESGHLIDGHWDPALGQWKDGKQPIPYTRDFIELMGAYNFLWRAFAFKVYSGFSYTSHERPANLARWATLHGIELHTTGLFGSVLGKPFTLYVADHLSVSGIPTYYGTNNVESGVKFGAWEGAGIKLYVSYYDGLEPFSQYYYERTSEWGAGFAFDFW